MQRSQPRITRARAGKPHPARLKVRQSERFRQPSQSRAIVGAK